ncbi:hypothetical protein LINPERPRIM_LOCUS36654, partial [Linum perenne]
PVFWFLHRIRSRHRSSGSSSAITTFREKLQLRGEASSAVEQPLPSISEGKQPIFSAGEDAICSYADDETREF